MKVIAIIPAYNEARRIASTIDEVKKYVDEIIVVDDGSSDEIGEIVHLLSVVLLRHIVNRGQGAAIETGNQCALDRGADLIVHFDADGQFDARDIARGVDRITKGNSDAVLGSRFLDIQSDIPFFRKIILYGAKLFNRFFLGITFTDPQSGFRILTRQVAEYLTIDEDRMAHCSQILEQLSKSAFRIEEIPIKVRYTAYSKARGQSSLNAFSIAGRLLFNKLFKP
ncbi:MAG: glycosyltransferase family 2 protein [Parcubacteria group bacterium]|nr:glycosyltransferase family 2 protein [Parcubacteria group bacterium]